MIEVHTQAELNAALKKDEAVLLVSGSFEVETTGDPHIVVSAGVELRVVARESSQPRVVAWESSQPRVVAWESSQPRVVAWESSQPRVEARESSQPRVVARGYAQLSVIGRVIAECAAKVSVLIQGDAEVQGGQQTRIEINTPTDWCDYYGIEVKDSVATLYKAVGDDFRSPHGIAYTPGTQPEALDWDGGSKECGGGLHFSPVPTMARSFNPDAKRFVACPVALSDIAVHPDGMYPEKCKAARVCAPCFEVDEDGEPI